MTVTYTAEVATCRGLGVFWKLLFRWRGSIYKLLWPNLAVYSVCYFTLSAVYRFCLEGEQKEMFEKISLHCRAHSDLIPVSFVLGFYVSIVIKRWWDQYMGIPWPDNLAMFVSTLIHGNDERGRLMRRTILRYVNLCFVVTLCMMCPRVKKRFPTLDHLVEAGFLQPTEQKIFEDLNQKTNHPKYWMPLVWAGSIVTRARKEGRVRDDFSMKTLIDGLCTFRGQCGGMLNYDWISIPLVYTQVVTLAVYIFFLATLMGHQFLDPAKNYQDQAVDLVVPVFTFLQTLVIVMSFTLVVNVLAFYLLPQFFFYMGWLKVAESLVNPFGEDDDDFEVNWLVDRNLQVSYLIVDEMHNEHPELVKDQYWDEVFPAELPYTAAAKQYQTGPPQGSTNLLNIREDESEFLPMETVLEESELDMHDDDDDDALVDMDGIQLDIEGKRKETHPMRILMGRKSSISSKLSVQSSSVVGGGQMNGRCRNGDATEGIGRSLMGLSYSSSTTKAVSSSFKQKNLATGQHTQATFRQSGRKNSVLSMFTKMFHKEDPNRGGLRSNHGSNASLRSHRRGAFGRSVSRVSCSQANSRTSINRENTADFQDEIFKMSDLSLCSNENEVQNAHQRQRKRSQQQYHQSKRKTSAKFAPAENVTDASREESRTRVGNETPSTVASTPCDGEKEGMLGRRVWVKKKKGKEAVKDTASNEEEELDDEEFEDDVEDNGLWFSKKKTQETDKLKRKEESSDSPTVYFRRENGIDDQSLHSDSSVKTSFYHGSWEALTGSKGIGSVTTLASSHVAKTGTPTKTDLSTEQSMTNNKVAMDQHQTTDQGSIWTSSAESWAGNDKINDEIPALTQSLGSYGQLLYPSSARVVVPRKSGLPLKHVFEPKQASLPAHMISHSLVLRNKVTSKLSRGIAQMAAGNQDSDKIQAVYDNTLNINVAEEKNDGCDKVTFKDSVEKLLNSSELTATLGPQNGASEPHTNDDLISFPSLNNPSKVDATPAGMSEQISNSASSKLSNNTSPVLSSLIKPNSDLLYKSLMNENQEVPSGPTTERSMTSLINSGISMADSTYSKSKTMGLKPEVLEDTNNAIGCDTDSLNIHNENLEKAKLIGVSAAKESSDQSTESSYVFQPHIPSTAIPVPSVISSHDPCSEVHQQVDDKNLIIDDVDSCEVNSYGDTSVEMSRPSDDSDAVVSRRRMGGLRDFVELEPIEENVEFSGHAAIQNNCKVENAMVDELITNVKEDVHPETSV